MKIAMIVISNRPEMLERFTNSLDDIIPGLRNQFELCCLLQPPFTGEEPCLAKVDRWALRPAPGKPTPFAKLRKEAMLLYPDCDWYWSLDDDHYFANSGGETFTKTCYEFYYDVFQYLKYNHDAGVLTCRGYVGGYSWGYDFKVNPDNGLVATDKGGIFFRNIGPDSIVEPEEEELVGALFESLASYNIMSFKLNHVRRYNSPIKNVVPGAEKRIDVSENISYSNETVNANIQGHIREKFQDPNWTHSSKKYPAYIARMIGK